MVRILLVIFIEINDSSTQEISFFGKALDYKRRTPINEYVHNKKSQLKPKKRNAKQGIIIIYDLI